MYSLDEFGEMISDKVRFAAYSEAIARAVKPGDAVADIGSGPGILAFLACRAGARRVFAIEMDGVVDFARHLAESNGLSDRIEFLKGNSRQIRLPEKVDVIVSDLRGALPLFDQAILSVNDARERFLADRGILIPQRDVLFAAIVDADDRHRRITSPWRQVNGLNLSASLPTVLNGLYKAQFKPEQILSQEKAWCTVNYGEGANTRAAANLSFRILRDGTAHGLGLWFETDLYEGIGFSTGPRAGETVYGHVFLPWLEPVKLAEGEEVLAELHADPVGTDYIWRWITQFSSREGRPELRFEQSNFYGASFPPSSLRRRAAEFTPVLSEEGQAERWMLQAMNGQSPLQEIAVEASRLFPHVFAHPEEAFRRAGELADKFSR
ncbi:MAG TPA: 50S ribosomal protein L11 methyltransferase [Terriglobales bacterium]|nr:50S ribosomal protein L11 methyltransferase [Terriglobales bacterium]